MSKRDEIAEIVKKSALSNPTYEELPEFIDRFTKEILALLTDKWVVVEECSCLCHQVDNECVCHGTGTITRQATWEELEEALEAWQGRDNYLLKSGGRLRRKEAKK